MSPIEKATVAHDLGIGPQITDPTLVKRLNEQNIWQVLGSLPGEYTKEDILDYLKYRNAQLNDLIQDYKTMSVDGEPSEISMQMIGDTKMEYKLSEEDVAELAEMFQLMGEEPAVLEEAGAVAPAQAGAKAAKFAVSPKEAAKTSAKASEAAAPTGEEIVGSAQSTLTEVNDFLAEFEYRLMDVQLQMALEGKNEELKQELQRILGLVRSGQIDAVFLLVALAKVNSAKNGLIFTQFGKKLWKLNDEATKVVNDLYMSDTTSTQYAAQLQMTAQEQKEIGMQQQFLIQDMQKVTQNIETVMTFARTAMDEVFKTKQQIVNAINMR